jgi:hypothetical protein
MSSSAAPIGWALPRRAAKLAAGRHAVTANYSGAADFASSTGTLPVG